MDGIHLFDSEEPGHVNQCNSIYLKDLQAEPETFLDRVFDHLLQSYGDDSCRKIFGVEGHVRQEAQMRTSPKISEYLQNLKLTSVAHILQKREVGLTLPPHTKQEKVPIVVYGKGRDTAWGSKIYNDELTPDNGTSTSLAGKSSATRPLN